MKTLDQQDVYFYTVIIVTSVFGRGSKQQFATQASSKHLWSFMGASWRLPGSSWGAPRSNLGSQNVHFYTGFISIFASGRFWGCKAASTDQSCFLSASWRPPGSLLEASWGAPGGHLWSQNVHFYTSFISIFASGRFRGCKAASTSNSCFLRAPRRPPESLLEAPWVILDAS